MTIVVTVRVNDGIVLAGDSATSFIDRGGNVAKIYNNANKIFNLVKGWPIGSMTYGAGSIGSASISTLSKDLRKRLTPDDLAALTGRPRDALSLDLDAYTVEDVARKAMTFFRETYVQAYPQPVPNYFMGYRVCGYSAGATLPEAYEIRLLENSVEGPDRLYDPDVFGPRWAGETEAIDRLILGVGTNTMLALQDMGMDHAGAQNTMRGLIERMSANVFLPAMPIQDAIDLARFLADASIKFSHFSLSPATVGGPIEIATITKHEGFKWVSRKYYFSTEFNPVVDPNS